MQSMTGFGRASGETDNWRWAWEVRSVNGRGLDLRIRLPATFEGLDPGVRKAIQARFKRGSFALSLNATRAAGAVRVQVNQDVLREVLSAADEVQKATNASPPRVDGLLALKGVLENVESADSDEARASLERSLLQGLESALEEVEQVRSKEGARLNDVLTEKLEEISALTDRIELSPSRSPEAIQARLSEQIARILENSAGLDAARLHQEAIIVATRADVEEEVKRLRTHLAAARDLWQSTEPVGRQLDFLAQEFNREANTICSKAASDDISQAGLVLKTAIDQLREQVQNIE